MIPLQGREDTESILFKENILKTDTTRPSLRRICAVLFDMDGTLLDSEPAYLESDRVFLSDYGIAYSEEMNAMFTGRGSHAMMGILCTMFPDSPLCALPIEESVRLKDEAYTRYAPSRVKPFPATIALARALVESGIPLAIASGSSPEIIELMIQAAELKRLFSVRVSSVEVAHGKPAPDVFLEAARRLAVRPESCLVLEDSYFGVAAAKAAGMACVALPAPGSEDEEGFRIADLIVKGGAAALDAAAILSAFLWESEPSS